MNVSRTVTASKDFHLPWNLHDYIYAYRRKYANRVSLASIISRHQSLIRKPWS